MAGAPAKKPVDLAIVFGGKPGGKPPSHAEPDADEMGGASDGDADNSAEFDTAADEFMDDSLPPEERKAAFKRAVMACMGGEY